MMSRDLLSSEFGRRVAIEKLECRTLLSAGALDTSFGTTGQVTLPGSAPLAFNREPLAVQSDGKIVIAVGGSQTQIERLNTDGSPDNTFGSHGVITSPVAGVNAVAIESNGKILLGGYQTISSGQAPFTLARLNADGSIDTSFGSSGIITSAIEGYVGIQSLAIEPDGSIVAAGMQLPPSAGSSGYSFNLARFTASGTLDTGFNGTGEVTDQINHAADFNDAPAIPALAVQPDGKVLVGAASNADLAVWRFNTDGTPDSSFGTGGQVTTPVTYTGETNQSLGTDASVTNLIVQPDGQILAGGTIVSPASDDLSLLLARYQADGTPATAPTIVSPAQFGYETEQPAGMVLQADGKIVLGWYLPDSNGNGPFTFNAERLNSDFSADATFALPSATTIPVTTLAMASDGKVIVAGATSSSSGTVTVSRLLNDAPASSTGGNGSNGNGTGSNGTGSSGTGTGSSGTGSSGTGSSGTGSNSGTTGSSSGTGTSVGTSIGQQPLPAGQLTAGFVSSIPATAIAGEKATASIRITNSGASPFSGPVSVTIYASTDGTLSASAIPLATFPIRLKLRGGASRTINLKFKYPATLSGSYTLLASVTETAAKTAPAIAVDPHAISLASPTVDVELLPETALLTLRPHHPAGISVTVENFGNTTSTGNLTITLSAVPATQPAAQPQTVATVTRHIHLKPHAKLKIPIHFLVPANLAPGSYQVTPSILNGP